LSTVEILKANAIAFVAGPPLDTPVPSAVVTVTTGTPVSVVTLPSEKVIDACPVPVGFEEKAGDVFLPQGRVVINRDSPAAQNQQGEPHPIWAFAEHARSYVSTRLAPFGWTATGVVVGLGALVAVACWWCSGHESDEAYVDEARSGLHGPLRIRRDAVVRHPKKPPTHSGSSEPEHISEKVSMARNAGAVDGEFVQETKPINPVLRGSAEAAKSVRLFTTKFVDKTKGDLSGADLNTIVHKLDELAAEIEQSKSLEDVVPESVLKSRVNLPSLRDVKDTAGIVRDFAATFLCFSENKSGERLTMPEVEMVFDKLHDLADQIEEDPTDIMAPMVRDSAVRVRRKNKHNKVESRVHTGVAAARFLESCFNPIKGESTLGRVRVNLHDIKPRLFKLRIVKKNMLTTVEHEVNAWLHGNKLLTSWHCLQPILGDEVSAGVYQIAGSFRAVSSSMTFLEGKEIRRLPDVGSGNDLGCIVVSVPARLQKIALSVPVSGESCMLVAWDSHSHMDPGISSGVAGEKGVHTCPSVEGNCGGVLVSALNGSVIGFHNGGGVTTNRMSPVSDALLNALKEAGQLVPLN